jgi:hypothetical protein
MADGTVLVNPAGANGVPIRTFIRGDNSEDQYVREAPATAIAAPTSWTLAVVSAPTVIAADASRRSVILWNSSSSATVYLRYDSGTVTTAASGWHDQIPPGARLEVAKELVTLAQSFIASAAVGTLEIATATSA